MRRLRVALCAVGAAGLAALLIVAIIGLPDFGATPHPYGDRAVPASLKHETASVVASVTFDQRGLDTLGEEFILFAAAVATLLLLRRLREEVQETARLEEHGAEDVFEAVRVVGHVMLPGTLLVGGYIVLHGHVSPGGGFQGGVILASGLHLAYLAGDLRALERIRPLRLFDVAEAAGAAAFVVLGLAAIAAGSAFLTNFLPHGRLTEPLSAGTLPLLNMAIGLEVASAMVLLLSRFLEQALLTHEERG